MRLVNRCSSFVGGIVALMLVLGAGSARAGQVISTPLLEQQLVNSVVSCLVTDAGTKSLPIAAVKFLNENGDLLGVLGTCTFPGTIFPGESCVERLGTATGSYVRCEVDALGSGKALRVEMISTNIFTGQTEFNEGR